MNKKLFIGISVLYIVIALIYKPNHDYWAYLDQWDIINSGNSPDNPYGTVFNLFAYFNFIPFIHLPKALFVATYLIAGYMLWNMALRYESKYATPISIFVLFNPLFLLFGLKYGSNDTFLSGIAIIAAIFFINKKYSLAGLLFSIAIGFKFSPVFLLPFFIFGKSILKKRFLVSFLISIIAIFILGHLLWGGSVLNPLSVGLDRPSKSLSVFRYIRGEFQPLELLGINNADGVSVYFLVTSFLISILLYFIFRLDYLVMALFSFVNALLFFKVGHHQFYMLFLLLSILVFVKNEVKIQNCTGLKMSYVIFWFWFFGLVILYFFTGYQNRYSFIREIVGLPNTIILLTFNLFLLKFAFTIRQLSHR